jgi:hypothetical protein
MSVVLTQDEKIAADVGGDAKTRKGDYAVGYARPPKEHQFKKGQSGNPRGRPRKKQSSKDVWDQIMNQPMYIREDGKVPRKITK